MCGVVLEDIAFQAGRSLERLTATTGFREEGEPPAWLGAFLDRAAFRAAAALVAPLDPRFDEPGLRDFCALARPGEAPTRELETLERLRRAVRLTPRPYAARPPGAGLFDHVFAARAEARADYDVLSRAERQKQRVAGLIEADQRLSEGLALPYFLPIQIVAALRPDDEAGPAVREPWMGSIAEGANRLARLAREIERGAARLTQERLSRSPRFDAAVATILQSDHVVAGRNDRAARRLYDRLTAHGVLREMTGRDQFRIWGL